MAETFQSIFFQPNHTHKLYAIYAEIRHNTGQSHTKAKRMKSGKKKQQLRISTNSKYKHTHEIQSIWSCILTIFGWFSLVADGPWKTTSDDYSNVYGCFFYLKEVTLIIYRPYFCTKCSMTFQLYSDMCLCECMGLLVVVWCVCVCVRA